MEESKKVTIATLALLVFVMGVTAFEHHLTSVKTSIILATTTSTYDSGLLEYLIPLFEGRYGVEVRIIPVGTGQAIEAARRGDVDLILVHSRDLEVELVNSNYGVHRVCIMYNDFIIIGPREDPAEITGLKEAREAFRRIAEAGEAGKAIFISRADRSGTHMLELRVWNMLGVAPSSGSKGWYLEAGAGMGTVLRMANEKKAYTLTDRGTWLSFKGQLTNLAALVQGDVVLLNPYALILVNPERYPQRNHKGALMFARWMISEEGQRLIEEFKKEGETLFKPIAHNIELAQALGFPEQEKELKWYEAHEP